ncbi:MAG: hypothetical protein K2X77_33280 [Candidatus Obscuribacterales bacterium]|jgi:hypothetical protein|nr:hypothetical protein [Candidatus Obscuribacterales bacterium]
MDGFQGKPRSTETSTTFSPSEMALLAEPHCALLCNSSRELRLVRDGVIQGSTRRLELAYQSPLLTALEISGGIALGASFTWAMHEGGKIARAAKYGAFGLGAAGLIDISNRLKTTVSVYSDQNAGNNSETIQSNKRNVIADQIGAVLPDYVLGIASAGWASSLVSKHLFKSRSERIPNYYSKTPSDHGKNPQSHLSFRIDPDYLVYSTLTAPSRRILDVPMREQVTSFQNRAWNLDKPAFNYLKDNDLHLKILQKRPIENGSAISERSSRLVQQMKADPSFRLLLLDTEKALAKVKKEWHQNYSKTNEIMQENTGITFDRNIDVVITHPAIAQGTSRYGNILFTDHSVRPESFANQNTVYLWHETLHHHLPPKYAGKKEIDVAHAAIELATDNELRIRLNKGSYPPLVGHEFLANGRELLLPSWRNYLSKEKKDIVSYINEAAKIAAKH